MNVLNFIEREKRRKDLRIYTMDYGRKRARKYTFKIPQVEELGKLGKLVVNPQAFKEKYGKLLLLLNTNMVDEIIPTLVQFYDPTYHCFTFPDYQLMPTLEEYSRLMRYPCTCKIRTPVWKRIPTTLSLLQLLL